MITCLKCGRLIDSADTRYPPCPCANLDDFDRGADSPKTRRDIEDATAARIAAWVRHNAFVPYATNAEEIRRRAMLQVAHAIESGEWRKA